jgi:ribosomal protein S18 acetylase RimI-like enzyme
VPATVHLETFEKTRATIAAVDGSVVGSVMVTDMLNHAIPYWYIYQLQVKRAWRGQGIARQVMEEVIRVYGSDRLELVCRRDGDGLTEAQLAAFYQRLGFQSGPSASGIAHPSDDRRMYRNPAA